MTYDMGEELFIRVLNNNFTSNDIDYLRTNNYIVLYISSGNSDLMRYTYRILKSITYEHLDYIEGDHIVVLHDLTKT